MREADGSQLEAPVGVEVADHEQGSSASVDAAVRALSCDEGGDVVHDVGACVEVTRLNHRARTWWAMTEREARVIDAVIDYVRGKRDMTHQWPSLDEVARKHGWTTGFALADRSLVHLGARPFRIWQECQEVESEEPIHRRMVRAW